ncbi:hypothetical protein [Paucilactobacillus kaifaensis]|uniref:hypothetical protein n=1 Tax=Paucilactobacillus kaifaensis TaxID=2559921 RepID=UPI0010F6ACD7|nr:hypothetical protein [Paucilactobacillus kaifaensis]
MKYENDDQEPQTRQEYRKQQQASQDEFEKRDQQRVQVQREYSRTHRDQRVDDPQQDNLEEEPMSRSTNIVDGGQKVHQLKRKLNLVIIGLILAIIIVYLVLFFVG